MPFNSNSPTGSTLMAFSTFISTRGTDKDLTRLEAFSERTASPKRRETRAIQCR